MVTGVLDDNTLSITVDNLTFGVNLAAGSVDPLTGDDKPTTPATPSRKFKGRASTSPTKITPAKRCVVVPLFKSYCSFTLYF